MDKRQSTPFQRKYAERIKSDLEWIRDECEPKKSNVLVHRLYENINAVLKELAYCLEHQTNLVHVFGGYSIVEQEFRELSSIFENWDKRNPHE